MKALRQLSLSLFRLFAARAHRRLEHALRAPAVAQAQTLEQIVAFSGLSVSEFQSLPLQTYTDVAPQIEALRLSKQGLTRQKPLFYEPTSGSSGARKWIPYPLALLHSFTELFLCWSHDLLSSGPQLGLVLGQGRFYFSISPQLDVTEQALNDDSDYLSGPISLLFRQFALSPPVKALQDPHDFWRVLALYLLAAEDLEIISVWSPRFLLCLLEHIDSHRSVLADLLAQGSLTCQGKTFDFGIPSVQQLQRLQDVSTPLCDLFPALQMISCWGSENSRVGFVHLQALFPQVLVQEKGLLATEAPISFPSLRHGQFVPLLQEIYFEFLDVQGRCFKLCELRLGEHYELVISQKGGLLRYRLGDWIQVKGYAHATPCFDFVGRGSQVSDLVGEKLHAHFVGDIAQKLAGDRYICLLADLHALHYWLLSDQVLDTELWEQSLCENPHYAYARRLGQLSPLRFRVISGLPVQVAEFWQQQGLKWGDTKEQILYVGAQAEKMLAHLQITACIDPF